MYLSPQLPAAIATFASIFFLLLALRKIRKNHKNGIKSSSKEAPEASGAWPIIGHLHLLGGGGGGGDKLLYRTLGAMSDKYGPAFNIRLGIRRRAFVVSNWEVAKQCFTVNDTALASRPRILAADLMGYDSAVFGFAPYSPFWREMRKIATLELLSNRRLEMLKHVRSTEIDMALKETYRLWADENGSTSGPVPRSGPVLVEMKQWLEELALNVVVRMVAGKLCAGGGEEARRCRGAISRFFRLIGVFAVSDAIPILGWVDYVSGSRREMTETAEELDGVLGGWVEEHRRRRVSGDLRGEGKEDFIDVMLSLEEEGRLCNFPHDSDTCIKSTCLVRPILQ